jgi:DNA (cytosine-5)-methyltransferase 1
MKTSYDKKPNFIDLFAGCGGLSLGLEEAGFFPIFVNELNKDAMATYLINRRRINPLLEKKFNSFDVKEMVLLQGFIDDLKQGFKNEYSINIDGGELDLLVGGPPCQGFSGIGHRRSYSVEKKQLPSNHLYQDMAYVINSLKPKIFLFENVQGLLVSRWTKIGEKGEIWDDVKSTFSSIPGYTVRFSLVHAKDYGVPQNRPRILLVGIRDDLGIQPNDNSSSIAGGYLPKPIGTYPDLQDLLGDLVDPNYTNGGITQQYPFEPYKQIQVDLRTLPFSQKILGKGEVVLEQVYSKHNEKIVEKFRYMLDNNGIIPEKMRTRKFSQRVLPSIWGKNGPTITATSMPDDYVHFFQPRILTVREWARLQLFPDWYIFTGKRTTGGVRRAGNPREGLFERELPKYTQIGNAVPVGLAQNIGRHFMNLLREGK